METIPVGLVGVTGYTGMELARILATHPVLRLTRATSRAEAGKPLRALYPFLQGFPAGAKTRQRTRTGSNMTSGGQTPA